MKSLYDSASQESILRHALELEGSCIEDTLYRYSIYLSETTQEYQLLHVTEDEEFNGKGRFGQFLERQYFGLKTNNYSRPDFDEVSLELKVAPLKRLKSDNRLRAKERIVLGIIDYHQLVQEEFESSHFLYKCAELLLVFYIHDKSLQLKNLHVALVDIWRCLLEDKDQIQADWEQVVGKVRQGEADLISEGDTLLLGACTKGSTTLKSMVDQPYSTTKARKRAFCFKINYVNYIFETLGERKNTGKRQVFEKRLVPPGSRMTLEQAVRNILQPYFGIPAPEIASQMNLPYNPKDKGRYANLIARLIGLKRKKRVLHEFSATGIEVKTVRVLRNGSLAEAMSFKAINFCDIVEEEWEDSDFYQSVISKFVIVVFVENDEGEFNLHGVKFWNMPLEDYAIAEEVWNDTRKKIADGDYSDFIKESKPADVRGVAHVRPHGVRGQVEPTPQGGFEKPKSFWLDRAYVRIAIADIL